MDFKDSVVYGTGSYVGLYNFGSYETRVAIRHFTVRNILRDMFPVDCGVASSSPTSLRTPTSFPSMAVSQSSSPTIAPTEEDYVQPPTKNLPPIGLLVVISILLILMCTKNLPGRRLANRATATKDVAAPTVVVE